MKQPRATILLISTTLATAGIAGLILFIKKQQDASTTFVGSSVYVAPKGLNSIKTTLTISRGNITDITNEHKASSPESAGYMAAFDKDIRSAVIGKPVKDINLSRVGGASATTKAFQLAISAAKE